MSNLNYSYQIAADITEISEDDNRVTGDWFGEEGGRDDCQGKVRAVIEQLAEEAWDNNTDEPLAKSVEVELYNENGFDCSGGECKAGMFHAWIRC